MSVLAPLPTATLMAQLSGTKLVTSTASHVFRSAVVFKADGTLVCAWACDGSVEGSVMLPLLRERSQRVIRDSLALVQSGTLLTGEDENTGALGLLRVRYGAKGECLVVPSERFVMTVFLERK